MNKPNPPIGYTICEGCGGKNKCYCLLLLSNDIRILGFTASIVTLLLIYKLFFEP